MSRQIDRRAFLNGGLALMGGLILGEQAQALGAPRAKPKVVVWSEGTAPKNIYPNDVNTAIAEGLKPLKGWDVVTASINDPEQGLPDAVLSSTSVLIWWGHERHGDVNDALVERIVKRVKEDGMGFIATHSAHYSKALKAILGTPCGWKGYIDDGSKVEIIVKAPKHPIAKGVKDFAIPHTERYGDPFEAPTPDTFVFDGLYTLPDGSHQHAQQGMTYTAGKGKVFYFQPGHEGYPIYNQEEVRLIFRNAVKWAAPKK